MKRLLITGASGFVGSNLCVFLRDLYDVYGTYHKNPIHIEGCHIMHFDLTKKKDIADVLVTVQPHIIIHCAAIANVDYCEKHIDEAHEVNVVATENLCNMASPLGCQLIFISSDQVYSKGMADLQKSHEFSLIKALNFYTKTKLKGEERVKELCVNYQIIRLALSYGLSGGVNKCFTDGLEVAFKKRKPLDLYSNQLRSPILIDDVAVALHHIIEHSPPNELYNIGGPQAISRSDFGILFAKVFNYDERLVTPIPYSIPEDGGAERSFNTSLDCTKFINKFKYVPLSPEAGIKKLYLQKMMII